MRATLKAQVVWVALNERGFTLIEMMVVVGIISILAVVVTPNVVKFIDQTELGAQKAELRSVKTALHVMMADQRITAITSRAGDSSVNDWVTLPDGTGASSLNDYLESPTTAYYYCYDDAGNITRQDVVAAGSCR